MDKNYGYFIMHVSGPRSGLDKFIKVLRDSENFTYNSEDTNQKRIIFSDITESGYLNGITKYELNDHGYWLDIKGEILWPMPDQIILTSKALEGKSHNLDDYFYTYLEVLSNDLGLKFETYCIEKEYAMIYDHFVVEEGKLKVDEYKNSTRIISTVNKDAINRYIEEDWPNTLRWKDIPKPISPFSIDPNFKK